MHLATDPNVGQAPAIANQRTFEGDIVEVCSSHQVLLVLQQVNIVSRIGTIKSKKSSGDEITGRIIPPTERIAKSVPSHAASRQLHVSHSLELNGPKAIF